MKNVIAVDWLDKYGGAERVIKVIADEFDANSCYSLIDIMSPADKSLMFDGVPVFQTFIRIFGSKFRFFYPLFYLASSITVIEDCDVLITSSHSVAKNFNKPKGAFHVSYFQARNSKYIWDEAALYLKGWLAIFRFFLYPLRFLDKKAAKKPDLIVANSKFVACWIRKNYERDAEVVYPPVDLSFFEIGHRDRVGFVTVGRLEPYKRFDLIVKAFNILGYPLVVIGDGSCRNELERDARSNITFTGYLGSKEIAEYLGNSRAFVYAGIEDFGIAPVEAQACGTPVICLNKAGTAETVIDRKTGVLFEKQSVTGVVDAVKTFEGIEANFDKSIIRSNAERFSEAVFRLKFREVVDGARQNRAESLDD
jgi:Glycosyltransferase